ncbi:allantoicase [Aestuariivirga sp.]|uniref:allantoicase n=1 Tax=Aestuariivirga sp. TaxID=2650926 RepID=UPI0039E588A1
MATTTPELPSFARNAINLASPRLGAKALYATDEFFADKARMLADAPASFDPDKYDDNGKYMDGWESIRRRHGGHDFCIVKLGAPGVIRGVDIDTSFFTGNYPPAASLEACSSARDPDDNTAWTEILPAVSLGPSAHHFHAIASDTPWTHVRLHIYPDGGVARLRVYGEPVPSWEGKDKSAVQELSLANNGGRIIAYNNAHYGSVWTLLTLGRGINMGDGWETRRRREPGNDWIIVKLGGTGVIEKVEVDTCHYKGNYPDRCSLQAALVTNATDQSIVTEAMFWPALMGEQKLEANRIHSFSGSSLLLKEPVNHVKLNIFPDGGVSRLRIFGKLA